VSRCSVESSEDSVFLSGRHQRLLGIAQAGRPTPAVRFYLDPVAHRTGQCGIAAPYADQRQEALGSLGIVIAIAGPPGSSLEAERE
jgi:hypothetical protein